MLSRELRRHRSLAETPWQPRSPEPGLPPANVAHIWRIGLEQMKGPEQFYRLLSAEERARADRFHFEKDRFTYVYCRGVLRTLLGRYLNVLPNDISFHYTEYGKPYLSDEHGLNFNLSHAGGYALIAFTTKSAIGVDVEAIDRSIDTDKLVHRFFSPVEITAVAALSPVERPVAFFKLWTRKEALIKAHGAGLSLPLVQFGVSISDQEDVRVLHTDWAPEAANLWQIYSFTVAKELPGAIALKASLEGIHLFTYPAFMA